MNKKIIIIFIVLLLSFSTLCFSYYPEPDIIRDNYFIGRVLEPDVMGGIDVMMFTTDGRFYASEREYMGVDLDVLRSNQPIDAYKYENQKWVKKGTVSYVSLQRYKPGRKIRIYELMHTNYDVYAEGSGALVFQRLPLPFMLQARELETAVGATVEVVLISAVSCLGLMMALTMLSRRYGLFLSK